jgi:hypothetical protein
LSKKQRRKNTREPARYDPPFESEEQLEPRTKYKTVMVYMLDQREVNTLIEASTAPYVDPSPLNLNLDYTSYIMDEVVALIDGQYHPRRKKKK